MTAQQEFQNQDYSIVSNAIARSLNSRAHNKQIIVTPNGEVWDCAYSCSMGRIGKKQWESVMFLYQAGVMSEFDIAHANWFKALNK